MQQTRPSASLTPMQRRFMVALQRRLAATPDVSPTYEQMRSDLGLKSKSGVARLVSELVERGRISRIPRAERSMTVLVPVVDSVSGGDPPILIQSFRDEEIIAEMLRRGLLAAVVRQPV